MGTGRAAWGIWQVPETELQIFSEQLAGKDAIELGCGTAYISAWLSRRGARVVGIDNSEASAVNLCSSWRSAATFFQHLA
jgi:2-polyprenyl-3-methyl-5-hydroxy-6-metoxy-1,4-benzoquinol methylase